VAILWVTFNKKGREVEVKLYIASPIGKKRTFRYGREETQERPEIPEIRGASKFGTDKRVGLGIVLKSGLKG